MAQTARKLIDDFLLTVGDRKLYDKGELVNLLLDIRQALESSNGAETGNGESAGRGPESAHVN